MKAKRIKRDKRRKKKRKRALRKKNSYKKIRLQKAKMKQLSAPFLFDFAISTFCPCHDDGSGQRMECRL